MSTQVVDLRTPSVRSRVERQRSTERAMRTALGLVLAGALACAAAETVRQDAFERLIAAETEATRVAELRSSQARVAAELSRDLDRLAQARRVPMQGVLALVTEHLPNTAYCACARFEDVGPALGVWIDIEGADVKAVADAIRATSPWIACEARGSGLAISVPRDRGFEIAVAAPNGGTDAP